VTGGAGFIGSHVVEQLVESGHSVVVLDDLCTGRLENLDWAKGSPLVSLHRIDVSDFEGIRPHFEGIDWVFHLAARADIVPSIEQPRPYHNSNVNGTLAVLEAAHAARVKRLVYAASSTCYGIPDQFPTPESAPTRPMYPYALTKFVGEQYVIHWAQCYRLPAVSLRMFNVYGPRARTSGSYGAVFGVFLAQKLAGKPLTVVGDGSQTRDFTYVTDVASAFLAAAESDLRGEILNVGSGGTYSINSLAKLFGGEVRYVPKRPGEPDCTFADTTRIQRLLGWSPRVSFEEGVELVLAKIEHWRNAPVWDEESIAEATRTWFKYLGQPR
jgi:UDP-glucose 4-epimerase